MTRVLLVTGTGTDVGKTVVTAALAALACDSGRRVAVLKPAQTGVAPGAPGDLTAVRRLVGDAALTAVELARYPDPLAPDTAARRAGRPTVTPARIAAEIDRLSATHDVVLVEGAGGLLVRFDPDGGTLADVGPYEVLVVTRAGLGTLNEAALTTEALRRRGRRCRGLVIGSWPAEPDLAARCNLTDLPDVAGVPLLGALPAGMGDLPADRFLTAARAGLPAFACQAAVG